MVRFVFGDGYPKDQFVESVWRDAFSLCDTILTVPASRQHFLSNANEDFIAAAYDAGIKKFYTVELITDIGDLHLYANLVPAAELSVNFNPMLVLNIYKEFAPRSTPPTGSGPSERLAGEPMQDTRENATPAELSVRNRKTGGSIPDSPSKAPRMEGRVSDAIPAHNHEIRRRQVALFLAVKLAHQVWHLIHRQGSKMVTRTNISPERYREDVVEGTTYTVPYTDIGTVMERDVLGGVWDFISFNRKHFMSLDAVVVYPSTRATLGAYLDPSNTVITADAIQVRTLGQYRSKTAPKFPGCLACTGQEQEEDDEEEEAVRQPGTGGLDSNGSPLSKW